MSDCQLCPVEKDCHYPYKPCDCVHQRKFWSLERRQQHEGGTFFKANDLGEFCVHCGKHWSAHNDILRCPLP